MVAVKFKKLYSNARVPVKATEDAGCYDVYYYGGSTLEDTTELCLYSKRSYLFPSGVAVEIPKGYRGILTARSSQSAKNVFVLPGVIDSDYRGDIGPRIANFGDGNYIVKPGDRIAQFHIEKVEDIEWVEVLELGHSERGDKGFGSTGK